MARQKFDELQILSNHNGFDIRLHQSKESEAKGGAQLIAKDGVDIAYPIARVDRTDETIDINELIESLDEAFKIHWASHLQAPDHVDFPGLAYRLAIGLNHAHSLEHANRWPSGEKAYRFEAFKKDLSAAIQATENVAKDSEVTRLRTEFPEHFANWQAERKAQREQRAAEDALGV
jgi:hypothetical protein